MNKIIWFIAIIAVLSLIGFFSFQAKNVSTLSLDLPNLERLEKGHYEGWAIFGEEKISTGKFNVGDKLVFQSKRDLSTADKIVITIEADGDRDSTPSGIVILAGDVRGGVVDLNFPANISGISGGYILATPTNGNNTNETSGVWFLELPEPPGPSLVLPALPNGWIYEGWAVNQGTPLSTGRFTSATGADNFSGFSGTEQAPPFPGEDFLVNAPNGVVFPLNLGDGASKIVVSIEPDLDGVDPTGDGPFQVKPLVADVPSGALDHTNYSMNQNLDSTPSGSAIITLK